MILPPHGNNITDNQFTKNIHFSRPSFLNVEPDFEIMELFCNLSVFKKKLSAQKKRRESPLTLSSSYHL